MRYEGAISYNERLYLIRRQTITPLPTKLTNRRQRMSKHNLKSIKQKFKERGVFYTPPELAKLLKTYAPDNPHEVYDPTCGDGGLLVVFSDDVKKYGQEIDPEQLEVAKENLTNFTGYAGDTLLDDGFKDKKFSLILANPPFSIKWEQQDIGKYNKAGKLPPKSKADYAFLLHILDKLTDDGVAVTLNFPGILYRGQSEGVIRKWLVDMNYIDKIVHIPGDTFVDTKIATVLVILKKKRSTTDIEFEDRALDIKRTVTLKEIQENDYVLSPSSFVQAPEPVREPIDPIKLEMDARANILAIIEGHLKFSKVVNYLENGNLPLEPFIDEIIGLAERYRS